MSTTDLTQENSVEAHASLLIVVATYNEIDSLPRLIDQLNQRLPDADILVIDDHSPDGTGNWCEQAKQTQANLEVIHREGKLGLGSAAMEGFRWGLGRNYSWIATMDADLSHSPQSLAEMFAKVQSARDPVIDVLLGSRYVDGGGTEGWPWTRKLASRAVNGFARLMLRLESRDNSGAFRIYRAATLSELNLDGMTSSDFAYLEEILWRIKKTGAVIREHPIVFRNRELGRSKTNPLLGVRVFWQIFRLAIFG